MRRKSCRVPWLEPKIELDDGLRRTWDWYAARLSA